MKRIFGYICAFGLASSIVAQNEVLPPEVPDTLDLQGAKEYALDHNFAIRSAIESIEEQEGLIIEVKARARPSVTLEADYQRLDEGLSEFDPVQDRNWGIGLNISQALYQGGGIRAALRAQNLTRESVRLFLESTIMDAMLEVENRFYGTLLAREQILVEEQNVGLLEEALEDARNRLAAGTVSDFEVLRAEVLLANAQPALIQRRSAFRIAIEQLRQSIGYVNYRRDPGNLDKVPEFLGNLDYVPAAFDLAISLEQALANRSELERLSLIEEARGAGVDIAKADYLPSVDLVGSYGSRKSLASDSFDDGLGGWSVGVVASWDIFDGSERHGKMRQAKSRLEQARIDKESLRLEIEVEVRQAMSEFQEAQELVAAADKGVEQAEEALRLANSRYAAGSINQLDVLEAQVSLTESRTNGLEANYRHIIAVANLRRAIGMDKPDTLE